MPDIVLTFFVLLGPPLGGVVFLFSIMHLGIFGSLIIGAFFSIPVCYLFGGLPATLTGLYPYYCLRKTRLPNLGLLLLLGTFSAAINHLLFRYINSPSEAGVTEGNIFQTTFEQAYIGFTTTAILYAITKKKMNRFLSIQMST